MFNQPGELRLVVCRHSLAGSLSVGLRGHNPRLVGHHRGPRDARQNRMLPRAVRGQVGAGSGGPLAGYPLFLARTATLVVPSLRNS